MKQKDVIFQFLYGFRILTQSHTIFRYADEEKNAVNPEYCFHTSRFCTMVKSNPELFSKCNNDCALKALIKAKSASKPFIKTCHAKAKEIVFPVYSNGEYKGSLFIGPYKSRNHKTYKIADKSYLNLQTFSSLHQKGVYSLFYSFSNFLINETEKMLLVHAERGTGNEKIQKAIRLINLRLSSNLPVGYLSRECGLSYSRFVHLFKEKTGYSISDYIIRKRLEKAKTMLASKAVKISEIASECGYSNQNYFSLAFKKYTGSNPTKYRESFILQP